MTLEPTKRLSNFEALRILALVLIIGVHVCSLGLMYAPAGSSNWLVATLLTSYTRFGVDVFVLIASYFMCSKMLDAKGIARRWWVVVYPVIVLTCLLFLFSPPASSEEVYQYVEVFLLGTGGMNWHGIAFGQLWYIFPFMLLVAISPLLNHAIRSMSREEHKAVMLILIFLFIVIPTINIFAAKGVFFWIGDTNTSIVYFTTLYIVAAYIRKYDVSIAPLKGIGISAILGLAAFASVLVYSVYLMHSTLSNGTYDPFFANNTLFIFGGAVFLFLSFKSMSFSNRGVSFTGKLTYEAYLFHTVMLYLFSIYWPATTSSSMPTLDYTLMVLAAIVAISAISLGYSLLRYGMDRALMRLAKVSRISTVSTWAVSRLMNFGHRTKPSDK